MNALPVSKRIPLRRRVTLAYTLLGFMLSLLFAGAALLITEDYEHILVTEILTGQAEDYSLRLVADPATPLPQTHRLSGYRMQPGTEDNVPAAFAALPPGIHESDAPNAEGIHIGVFDTAQGRMVFVIDLRDIETLELHLSWFLAGVIVLGTLLAGWLGWLMAGATVAPVRRLAAAVDALPTQPQATDLAADTGHDDLGRLAAAIDRYQARLADADVAERQFFADASHELRTPVAVVRGAVEVLLDEPGTDPRVARRLQRLDRGMIELADLLEVLLGLARRRAPDLEALDAVALLREASAPIAANTTALPLHIDIEATGTVQLSRRESLLLLRSVIRRVLPPDVPGRLALQLRDHSVFVTFSAAEGSPMSPSAISPSMPMGAERSDQGLGLTLAGRLAGQLGWQIAPLRCEGGKRSIEIRLPAPASTSTR